ncbi:hypothetical protein tloyanaT_32500 [Thalassotalea loyana]|uniref:Wadjet protein JetD C-terminal domain-containing protein n=1 Tax=Thalassotalea loyana TaxID=280483 RepID=A0ABQ6HFX5_9GAMM|nr:hypothetical protein [Thalassotalea loyana]GLX86997.1 hypothetical protein tloyanaT_32500 [Thalassotalea loyana]
MKIDRYFEKIKNGQPINFSSFKKKARLIGLTDSDLFNLFEINKNDKSTVLLQIKDKAAFSSLCDRYSAVLPFNTRSEASKTGRSHSVKVNGTTFHVRLGAAPPTSVIVDSEGEILTTFKQSNSLLIIENEENFIDIHSTLKFLKSHAKIDITHMDVMWGAGNRAANTYLAKFYNNYDHLYCFFDFELGVLRTAQSIFNMMKDHEKTKFSFIVAESAEQDLLDFGSDLKSSQIKSLEKIRKESPILSNVINLMINTRKTMEQEVYL